MTSPFPIAGVSHTIWFLNGWSYWGELTQLYAVDLAFRRRRDGWRPHHTTKIGRLPFTIFHVQLKACPLLRCDRQEGRGLEVKRKMNRVVMLMICQTQGFWDRVSNQGIPRGSHYMPGCQYKKTLKFPMPAWQICFSYSLSLYENWFLHARNPQEWHRIHYISRQDVFVKQLACSSWSLGWFSSRPRGPRSPRSPRNPPSDHIRPYEFCFSEFSVQKSWLFVPFASLFFPQDATYLVVISGLGLSEISDYGHYCLLILSFNMCQTPCWRCFL